MSRAERLIDLQSLPRRRKPDSASALAEELNVSDRTIYRMQRRYDARGL